MNPMMPLQDTNRHFMEWENWFYVFHGKYSIIDKCDLFIISTAPHISLTKDKKKIMNEDRKIVAWFLFLYKIITSRNVIKMIDLLLFINFSHVKFIYDGHFIVNYNYLLLKIVSWIVWVNFWDKTTY